MDSQPLVSVLTSCFNHEKYLHDYFMGLLKQTYDNIEVIFFDDGSTDKSWVKAQEYELALRTRFPRVVFERRENIGALREWALAVKAATGKYACFLDSDDFYYPTKIESNVKFLERHTNCGAVYSDFDRLKEGSTQRNCQKTLRSPAPVGDVLRALFDGCFIATPTFCVRSELLRSHVDFDEFDHRRYLAGDYPMWLTLAKHTRFGFIAESLACYRVLEESGCHSKDAQVRYKRSKSAQQMRMDFAKEYAFPASFIDELEHVYHGTQFWRGYALLERDDFTTSYRWLAKRYPEKYNTWKSRMRMTIVNNERMWKAMRWIEDRWIVRKLFGEYQL